MDCHRTTELLSPFIDGELPLALSGQVLAHLKACPSCRSEAEALRSLGGEVRELTGQAPTGLGARILSEARAGEPNPRPWQSAMRKIPRIASAWPRAAALLLGAASVALFLTPPSPAPRPSQDPAQDPAPVLRRLVSETEAALELAGSFRADLRVLAARPEGRLLDHLTRGRR